MERQEKNLTTIADFEERARYHGQRQFWMLEKVKKQILPQDFQKGTQAI